MPEEVLQEDLEKYRQMALDLGASDAVIINTEIISVDDRVRIKCIYPKCEFYGTNAHCPPHALDLDQVRTLVNSYRYAVFLRVKVPTEIYAGERTPENMKKFTQVALKHLELLGKLEAEAFYDGHYLSVAFGAGSCKSLFCPDKECAVLKSSSCRHPFKARSSLEAMGIDGFQLAARVGWDIFPIGRRASDAPYGSRLGIVFIH